MDDEFYCEHLSEAQHNALADAGYRTYQQVCDATVKELIAISTIGEGAVKKAKARCRHVRLREEKEANNVAFGSVS